VLRFLAALALASAGLAAGSFPAGAQNLRGSVETTARFFEFRPLGRDSVPRSEVTRRADGTLVHEGRPVECQGGDLCFFAAPAGVDHGIALTQDISFTSWGYGVQGLSATVLVRGRRDVGDGGFVWPESNDDFDAILAYAQLARERFRIRVGRQRNNSGLGFASYDGGSFLAFPTSWVRVEGFGGRSLARGLHEPRNDVLQGVEDFVPDREAYILGGALTLRPVSGTTVTGRYQREFFIEDAGLITERVSVDARSALLRPLRVEGSLDYDVAFDRIGKSHLTFRLPVRPANLTLEATGRRYVPYFELNTIWGFFDPVAYHEGELRASWSPWSELGLWVGGGLRFYEDTDTDPILGPLEDDGQRIELGARYRPTSGLTLDGRYEREWDAGAFRESGELRARWRPTDRLGGSVFASGFQQIQEFRIGEGTVFGGGGSLDVELWQGIRARGGAAVYRQLFENRPGGVDWNQVRAWSSLRIPVGSDPGIAARRGR